MRRRLRQLECARERSRGAPWPPRPAAARRASADRRSPTGLSRGALCGGLCSMPYAAPYAARALSSPGGAPPPVLAAAARCRGVCRLERVWNTLQACMRVRRRRGRPPRGRARAARPRTGLRRRRSARPAKSGHHRQTLQCRWLSRRRAAVRRGRAWVGRRRGVAVARGRTGGVGHPRQAQWHRLTSDPSSVGCAFAVVEARHAHRRKLGGLVHHKATALARGG